MKSSDTFKSKFALITGGANGIGRAIVMAYAGQGGRVVLVDWDKETGTWLAAKLRKQGRKAEFLYADLASPASIAAMAEAIKAMRLKLDLLVNNAAIGSGGTVLTRPEEEWHKVLAVNLSAPYLCVKHLLPLMNQGASIINLCSTRALQSMANTEPYSASKGGILALTHSLAVSLQKYRIRVNAISPGWIETSAWQGRRTSPARLRRVDHDQHPAGRVGKPEDIAEACLFLADSAKSGFITGSNMVVDGGMTRKMIYEE